MEIKEFKASSVYKRDDVSVPIITYPREPIVSDESVTLLNKYMNVKCFVANDCTFLMSKSQNPGLVYNNKKQHIVSDESKIYCVTAFLGKKEDKLDNGITLMTRLPKGVVMRMMEAVTEVDVYTFSGFNVALFDEIPD